MSDEARRPFKVGDRIRVVRPGEIRILGEGNTEGVVRCVDNNISAGIGVEFFKNFSDGHDLTGRLNSDRGRFFYTEELVLVEDLNGLLSPEEAALAFIEGKTLVGQRGFTKSKSEGNTLNDLTFLRNFYKLYEEPPSLEVYSLDYTLEIKDNELRVGCQSITKEDALEIADYIQKHLGNK